MASSSNYVDDQLDPRIKGELDALNSAAESINKLENEIQKARSLFKKHKAECAHSLKILCNKIGKKMVARVRVYYDSLKALNKLQQEEQKSAARSQRAISLYKTAQETVSLAEQQLTSEDGSKLKFDTAWQEMLNHANLRFMEAEKEKRACEEEYEACSKECSRLQLHIGVMRKEMTRAIEKSKPFYEMKQNFEKKLQIEKQNAEDLQLALICSKQKYKLALSNLEQISEEIHMQRDHSKLPHRTPGVGAESDACSELSEIFSANLDFMSDNGSQVSRDDFASDFHLDESWNLSCDEDAFTSGKASANTFDNFFGKVGKKFRRSSSMGNLNLSLQIPGTEKVPSNLKSRGNLASTSSRDSTLEGAEQPPDRHESSQDLLNHRTYTSTVFLPISYPIDKARQDIKRESMMSKERKGSYHPSLHQHIQNSSHFVETFQTSKLKSAEFIKPWRGQDMKLQHPVPKKAFQIDKNVELSF